jgi:hypothetical protein
VKFIKADKENLVFQIGKREKRMLFTLLELYPLLPSAYQRLTAKADTDEAKSNQKLLEEAVAAQQQENKKQLMAMMKNPRRFKENHAGYQFTLGLEQVEWLFQVLNDIRVGSWTALGSPDEKKGRPVSLAPEGVRHLWAMELCGFFESVLLDALHGRGVGGSDVC